MIARLIVSLVATAFAASQLAAEPMGDPEAAKVLVGSWVVPRDQVKILTKDGCITFKPDGTFSAYGVFRIGNRDCYLETEGKWNLKDGILFEEITSSSDPQIVPAGWTTRDTLLAVTDKEYRFRTEDKAEYTYLRK